MATERTKFKKVNERKRNMPLLCAPSIFINQQKEYDKQSFEHTWREDEWECGGVQPR